MSRKCGRSVTTDVRRTLKKVLGADKEKVHHDQAPGNNNKDAMFDCRNSFPESKKKRNCHTSVTSVMIITFIMFSLAPLVLSLLCVYDICMLYRNVCVESNDK